MIAARVGEHSDVEWKFVKRSPALAIRSIGVGMTPPKVLGAPKPWSSVIMSRTLGAAFGGTTRGGHHGFDSEASSLITPPNFGSGGGSCFPVIVVVASGEPGTPVVCCATPDDAAQTSASVAMMNLFMVSSEAQAAAWRTRHSRGTRPRNSI